MSALRFTMLASNIVIISSFYRHRIYTIVGASLLTCDSFPRAGWIAFHHDFNRSDASNIQMPRQARVHYVPLKSSLVNLPISIYGPLLERGTVRVSLCFVLQ